jgi:hypothetical protein
MSGHLMLAAEAARCCSGRYYGRGGSNGYGDWLIMRYLWDHLHWLGVLIGVGVFFLIGVVKSIFGGGSG